MFHDENTKNVTASYAREYIYMAFCLGLTFAGLNAVEPPVISIFVDGTFAVLIPSTARSATTDSAGFFERATLWAGHIIAGGDD